MHGRCDQVKVFWPGMGKWYAGKVAAYDGRSAKHTILYKDGDVQRLTLRQEAVVWPDVPGLDGPGLAARLAGEADAAEVRAHMTTVTSGWILPGLKDGPCVIQPHHLGWPERDLCTNLSKTFRVSGAASSF